MNLNRLIIDTINNYIKALNLRIGRRYKKYLFNLVLEGVNNITLEIL